MARNVLEAVRAEAPGATVVAVASGEVYGPPDVAAGRRVRAAAPAEPVRGLEGLRRPARRLLRRRPRPAGDPRAAVQPRGPGAGADLRDRLLRAPGARRAADPRGSSPATRTRGATTPTCATSCAPTGCSPSAPSRGSTTSARAAPPRRASCVAMLGRDAGARSSTRRPGLVRAHEVMEVRGSPDRLRAATGWEPEIPLERTLADTVAWWRAQGTGQLRSPPSGSACGHLRERRGDCSRASRRPCAVGGAEPLRGRRHRLQRVALGLAPRP